MNNQRISNKMENHSFLRNLFKNTQRGNKLKIYNALNLLRILLDYKNVIEGEFMDRVEKILEKLIQRPNDCKARGDFFVKLEEVLKGEQYKVVEDINGCFFISFPLSENQLSLREDNLYSLLKECEEMFVQIHKEAEEKCSPCVICQNIIDDENSTCLNPPTQDTDELTPEFAIIPASTDNGQGTERRRSTGKIPGTTALSLDETYERKDEQYEGDNRESTAHTEEIDGTKGSTENRIKGPDENEEYAEPERTSGTINGRFKVVPLFDTPPKAVQSEQSYSSGAQSQSDFVSGYGFVQLLGKGSCGSVYKMVHEVDDHAYAVKEIKVKRNQEVDKMTREVKILAKLQHASIVRYFYSWLTTSRISSLPTAQDGQYSYLYIQMELCQKQTLKDWLENNNKEKASPSTLQTCFDIFRQIVDALDYIHQKEIIHRDLKPSNILFPLDQPPGSTLVKIGDFGLARDCPSSLANDESEHSSSPNLTDGVGDIFYTSPEQMTSSNYSYPSDVFSSGIILFELYYIFDPYSARKEILTNVGAEQMIPKTFRDEWPQITKLALQLLQEQPSERLTAKQIKDTLDGLTFEEWLGKYGHVTEDGR